MILVEPGSLKSIARKSSRQFPRAVQPNKARDAKERGAEHDGATGGLCEGYTLMEHVETLARQERQNEAEKYGCGSHPARDFSRFSLRRLNLASSSCS